MADARRVSQTSNKRQYQKKKLQRDEMFMERTVLWALAVAGMLAQCPQSIYAEDAANTATVTDTESNHVTPDTTQQPDDTKQPGDTQQPDDTKQPGDIQQPDDIQQPEELPQPSAVEGLHTTKQGKTKVYLNAKIEAAMPLLCDLPENSRRGNTKTCREEQAILYR